LIDAAMAEILADDPDLAKRWDVLVVGGGNAALCAAISARREGASVLVVEAAPKFYRGGNRATRATCAAPMTAPRRS
jgi:tricarballylate dehydrogenase